MERKYRRNFQHGFVSWDFKTSITFTLQFFMPISDGLGGVRKVNMIDYDVSFSDKNVVHFCRKFRLPSSLIINNNLQSQWPVNYDFN